MSGGATTETQQSSQTSPWAPATPYLTSALGQLGNINTSVTPEQQAALNNLQSSASSVPNMGNAATGAVNNLFNSSTAPQVGMLKDAFGNLQSNIGSTANGSQLDPYSTPGFSDAINTAMSDITNQVKGVYAGSGRDPSGAGSFSGSLGRGLTQGIAPIIQNQYNTNKTNQLNAASTLYGAGNTTASGITNQDQTQLQNGISGITNSGLLSSLFTQPATTQLAAANAAQSQPLSNMSGVLSALTGIAGLGGQSTGTGSTTQNQSTLSNILGGATGGLGILGTIFSDENLKENIEKVGDLHDGQPIFSYNYKGEDVPRIGLLAQNVEKAVPEAVHRVGSHLAVNYGEATKHARRAGMLSGMLKEAA